MILTLLIALTNTLLNTPVDDYSGDDNNYNYDYYDDYANADENHSYSNYPTLVVHRMIMIIMIITQIMITTLHDYC